MRRSYRASLNGDRLVWIDSAPGVAGPVEVTVIVEEADPKVEARRQRALAALEALAARGGIARIADPVEWQREQRRDRPLPGRDEVKWSASDGREYDFTGLTNLDLLDLSHTLWACVSSGDLERELTPEEVKELDVRLDHSADGQLFADVMRQLRQRYVAGR